jgi:DNA-binding winged helix-turn-helix (wHTH) protein
MRDSRSTLTIRLAWAGRGCTSSLRSEDFSLDSERRELRRAGDLIVVEPQVFDLIDYLVSCHDRVVSKDELLDKIWVVAPFRNQR